MKLLTLAILLAVSLNAKSQKDGAFYVYDANWNPTSIDSAFFLLHTHKVNDTCWQFEYYNFTGPMIKMEQYRDRAGTVINGVSHHYNEKGIVDSTGNFHNGKRNGEFLKLEGNPLKYKWRYIWSEDSLISVTDLENTKKDSARSYPDEKESSYPGDLKGWIHYLQRNLKYPERAMNLDKQGQVSVRFVVDKEGNVNDCYISVSVEYSLDEEALRIVRESGRWEPAFMDGHHVKSYKLQPINFRLE